MKTVLKKCLATCAIVIATLGISQAQANEMMFKLFIQAQDFSDHQEQLAYELLSSVKALTEQVKKPKQELKDFAQEMADKEQLDVEAMVAAYNSWKTDVDDRVYVSLQALANFHAELSPEQKKALLTSIKKLKSK